MVAIDMRFHNLGDNLVVGNIGRQHWDLDKLHYDFTYQLAHNILDCKGHNTRGIFIATLRKKCYTKRCRRVEILIPLC